jgi:hypothetical protein
MLVLTKQKIVSKEGNITVGDYITEDKHYAVGTLEMVGGTNINNLMVVKDAQAICVCIGDLIITTGKDSRIKTVDGFKEVRYLNSNDRIPHLVFGELVPSLVRIIGTIEMIAIFSDSPEPEITLDNGYVLQPIEFGIDERRIGKARQEVAKNVQ